MACWEAGRTASGDCFQFANVSAISLPPIQEPPPRADGRSLPHTIKARRPSLSMRRTSARNGRDFPQRRLWFVGRP
jgi:hypothetical protein